LKAAKELTNNQHPFLRYVEDLPTKKNQVESSKRKIKLKAVSPTSFQHELTNNQQQKINQHPFF